MNQILKGALVANAASLGVHWIYNTAYLNRLSEQQDLLFQKQSKRIYEEGQPSYYVYPKAEVGDHTLQGMFLIWLYEALNNHPELSKDSYEQLIFEALKPGGFYEGYVESYAKRLIIKKLSLDLNIPFLEDQLVDHHLVGFMPYLACRALGISSNKAWELAQAFTTLDDYPKFYHMFDYIFEKIQSKPLSVVLKDAIPFAPENYQNALNQALVMTDVDVFIKKYAGIACYLPHSIPLIFYILAHSNGFEEAIQFNARLGGASSDRGLLLGAILSKIYEIPQSWIEKTKF